MNPPRALAKRGDLPDLLNPPVVLLVDGVGCDGSLDTHTAWDECGVCGGNSTSCRGCDGVLYSGLEFDVCGVCNGTNTTCIGGCDQQPRSNKFYDICGVCGGDGSSCAGCDGVPEPDILLRYFTFSFLLATPFTRRLTISFSLFSGKGWISVGCVVGMACRARIAMV